MGRISTWFRQNRCALVIGTLRLLLYGMMLLSFFGFMAINNWQLKNPSRTLASSLLIYVVMSVIMHSVYGGYDVGRKKSKPVISAMFSGAVLTDLVTYLQLQIMNVNDNNNDHLILFGEDFPWLLLCILLQMLLVILLVRIGNTLYFRMTSPRSCLLILAHPGDEEVLRSKIGRYRLQWRIDHVSLYNDPELEHWVDITDVVFFDELPPHVELRLMRLCYEKHRDVMCKAQLHDVMLSNARTAIVDDAAFLEIDYSKGTLNQRLIKRGGDILLSALALLLTAPLMLFIGIAIKCEDRGPVLFRQERLTGEGRTFLIRKFRTMTPRASVDKVQTSILVDDPRITHVGKFLRRWRLDELPQFFNILIGDMSLVGPRPEMLSNVDKYKEDLPDFVYREKMKAGLTGLAQIEGRYNTSPQDKLMMDLMYIESFSVWLDIKLILRTFTILTKKDSTQGFGQNTKATKN